MHSKSSLVSENQTVYRELSYLVEPVGSPIFMRKEKKKEREKGNEKLQGKF